MAFTTNMTGTTQVNDSILLEFDQQFIIASADQGIMDQLCTYKKDIGAKSISLPKYAQLALATTPLTEDEDATSEALSDSEILVTPKEFGKVVTKTKLASLQTGGTVDVAAARLVGLNMGRSMDKIAILRAEASANELIVDGGTEAQIRAMSREKGHGSLLDSGVNRMLEGVTTAEEVLRVTFADNNNG